MSADLVVGVDVGSQGTCAQAIAADGTTVATTYVPHALSVPQPGWAEQDPREWLGAVVRALTEVRRSVDGRPLRAISFGSQLDGLVGAAADGSPTGQALIWMDRRAAVECDQVTGQLEPDRLRELTGCNLDPGHVAAKIAWLRRHRPREYAAARWFLLPGSFVAWHAAGELAVDPSNASSSMLFDIRTRGWSEEVCAAFGVEIEKLPPIQPAHLVLGPVAPWLRNAAGLDGSTLVVLGCGDEMAATLGAGVIEPDRVRRAGNSRTRLCRGLRTSARSRLRHRGAPSREPGRLAPGEPRMALRRGISLVSRRARGRRAGPRRGNRRRRL